uniref:C6 zinc finger domain-containing protein n=1 Tax=Globodera pallida TaxID=36090 RepID=A0A183C5G5_GLOPA
MLIKEYRVVLPMTVEEYQVAHLFCAVEEARRSPAVFKVLQNEPTDGAALFPGALARAGRHIHTVTQPPPNLASFFPTDALTLHLHSWDAFPYAKTEQRNEQTGDGGRYNLAVESMRLSDRGTTEDVFPFKELLEARDSETVHIDIADDNAYAHEQDNNQAAMSPSTFHSERTGRGPLLQGWRDSCEPVMCIYMLAMVDFKLFGLGQPIEHAIHQEFARACYNFHRSLFCSMDRWHGLTLDQARTMEAKMLQEHTANAEL